MDKKTTNQLERGDLVAFPLLNDHWGLGFIAQRGVQNDKVLLGYFFNVSFDELPSIKVVPLLQPTDAIQIRRFADPSLGLNNWTKLGQLPNWQDYDWRSKSFVQKSPLTDQYYQIDYLDSDISIEEKRVQISPGQASTLPVDGVAGTKFLEAILGKAIGA